MLFRSLHVRLPLGDGLYLNQPGPENGGQVICRVRWCLRLDGAGLVVGGRRHPAGPLRPTWSGAEALRCRRHPDRTPGRCIACMMTSQLLYIQIELQRVEPLIWRRFGCAKYTFWGRHIAIQTAVAHSRSANRGGSSTTWPGTANPQGGETPTSYSYFSL